LTEGALIYLALTLSCMIVLGFSLGVEWLIRRKRGKTGNE